MKNFFTRYGGILLAALYGLLLRILFEFFSKPEHIYNIFGITFLGVVPVIIGIIPLFFASDKQLEATWYPVFRPALAVIVFFICCLSGGLEDLLCILVISLPYLIAAVVGGILARMFIVKNRKKKGRLYTILLLPLLLGPLEEQFDSPLRSYTVVSRITVDAKPEAIWINIIRVPEIGKDEYRPGFFNYAGIPRPLYAELDKDTLHATRTGHFEGGLKFVERVIAWEKNRHIAFDITVVPSSIRRTVFDQHMLKGDHFKFLNASYTLKPLPDGKTELILSSSYQLKTKINAYGDFWGGQLLSDFQERLLQVVRKRCEK